MAVTHASLGAGLGAGLEKMLKKRAMSRTMEDLTVGPVLSWTTHRMLDHVSKVAAIPGASLAPLRHVLATLCSPQTLLYSVSGPKPWSFSPTLELAFRNICRNRGFS